MSDMTSVVEHHHHHHHHHQSQPGPSSQSQQSPSHQAQQQQQQPHYSQQQQQSGFFQQPHGAFSGPAGEQSEPKHHCKECGLTFESGSSLEVHERYHHEGLMSQWARQTPPNQGGHLTQQQLEESNNNNNSKTGNHNTTSAAKQTSSNNNSVQAPADSSAESSLSRPGSGSPKQTGAGNPGAPAAHLPTAPFNHYNPMYHSEAGYYLQQQQQSDQQQYMMQQQQQQQQQHYGSPEHGVAEEQPGGNRRPGSSPYHARYHPYQHQPHLYQDQQQQQQRQQHSVSSTSPRSPVHCDKCGLVCEDLYQLGEHVRSAHTTSPYAGLPTAPPAQSQYQQQQQVGGSPQQQQVTQSQQAAPGNPKQQQQQQTSGQQRHQQPAFEFPGAGHIKTEVKQEPDDQAEILDLDSHKVQTHRFEDEILRIHHQRQQEMQMHMQHQAMHAPSHSVSSMLSWGASNPQPDYLAATQMGPIDSVSPIPDQSPYARMPPVESPRHVGSPIISSTQPVLPGHQLTPPGLLHQNPKSGSMGNQSWKSNEARRPKTYNCTACNKWFTSSGHLKRHYNTTLHKNAVKQSNQPDPANMPISAHHHPGRDSAASRGGLSASSKSPELTSSSSSPPNLMAGPSGEATRGLLNTPTNTSTTHHQRSSSNSSSLLFTNSNSNSSNGSECSPTAQAGPRSHSNPAATMLSQHPPSHPAARLYNPAGPMATVESRMAQPASPPDPHIPRLHPHHHHHHQQIPAGSPSPQLVTQVVHPHHHHHHHLPMGSPSHHLMSSPVHMSPISSPLHQSQQPALMTSTTASTTTDTITMGSTRQPVMAQHLHMTSHSHTSIMGSGIQQPPQQIQPSSPTGMMHHQPGSTMSLQPYPNGLPPHVTITNLPHLADSITTHPTTTGNDANDDEQLQQQQQPRRHLDAMSFHEQRKPSSDNGNSIQLPSFDSFAGPSALKAQQPLPSIAQLGLGQVSFLSSDSHHQYQVPQNVGGLTPEAGGLSPHHDKSYASSIASYDSYSNSNNNNSNNPQVDGSEPPRYELLGGPIDLVPVPTFENSILMRSCELQQAHQKLLEDNNNQPENQQQKSTKRRKPRKSASKENQVSSTNLNNNNNNNNNNDDVNKDELPRCHKCNKVFNKSCYLTQHNKSFHSGEKPFKCNQCGKRFPLEDLHAEHLRKHAGDKPHKCDVCPKEFNHKTDLRRHLCLHSGKKPYKCVICAKGFIRKDHMVKHSETHSKKKKPRVHLREKNQLPAAE